jgi:hypothetical protein
MRHLWLTGVLIGVLVACGGDKDDKSDPNDQPTPTPAPTSVLTGFTGPLLNPLANHSAQDCSLDPNATDCGIQVGAVQENALPLPLVMRQVLDAVTIGVPEDFETLVFGSQVSIETSHSENHPGDFRVLIQWQDADGVQKLLASYANLDRSRKVERSVDTLNAYSIPNGERGMVSVIEVSTARQLVIEAFVSPGYWPLYAATFNAMLASLSIAN